MTNARTKQPAPSYLTDISPAFHIVILYEDGDAGRRAKHLTDKLLVDLACQCECSRHLWSFDVLAIADIAETAIDAARTADLLIVSASGKSEFPPHIESWLGRWSWSIGDKLPALAALFPHFGSSSAHASHLFLSMLAHRRGIAYFPHRDPQPRSELVIAERAHLAEAAHSAPAVEDFTGLDESCASAGQAEQGEDSSRIAV